MLARHERQQLRGLIDRLVPQKALMSCMLNFRGSPAAVLARACVLRGTLQMGQTQAMR